MSTENDPDDPFNDLNLGPVEPVDFGPIEPVDFGPIEPVDFGPIEPVDLGPFEPVDLESSTKMLEDAMKDLSDPELELSSGEEAPPAEPISSPEDDSPEDDSPRPAPVKNTGNHKPEDVAEWIHDELEEHGSLSIQGAAREILEKYGAEFVWTTIGGNLSVSRSVVTILHKICDVEREADEDGEGRWRLK